MKYDPMSCQHAFFELYLSLVYFCYCAAVRKVQQPECKAAVKTHFCLNTDAKIKEG